ncbi:phosphatidylglycerophosphatase A family protein [Pandoraea commovens]|uniref:Phosphatidylglycerophosphatase A n=1 Tax=Pandoraea commovens TaxID=2508289 RepID=A0A5E4Z1H2_9BURK|nr:phosphatidylglycerophosphatase A [Pandoraea commovens]UVA78972.1 phosphatidylglycerophosphatase A [Pandoraea commovens]VVE54989.1 phosphatidylglycerophosphatase A [Pandoraea commovens]
MSTDQTAAVNSGSGPRRPNSRFLLSHPAHLFSLGFGTGLSSFAPGTVGTLFGWASYLVLNLYLTVTGWAVLIAASIIGGIWICSFTARKLGVQDPSAVVWDEIVAFWIVLLLITPASFVGQLVAFVLFRFFDAVKPPPISYFDRTVKGGLGIMLDDLVAAFCTLLVIALWRSI